MAPMRFLGRPAGCAHDAGRKQWTVSTAEKWLSSNLGYSTDNV